METNSIILSFKGTKEGELYQHVINFTDEQISEIKEAALQKTQNEWKKEKSGKKLKLTDGQKKDILKYKNDFFSGISALEAIEEEDVIFKIHATERVDARFGTVIDLEDVPLEEVKQRELEVVERLIDATEVGDSFEWKGYENVSFNFNGLNVTMDDIKKTLEKVTIVVTLDEDSRTSIITAFKKVMLEEMLKNKKGS